jgi:hypothetical protein
VVQNDEQFTLDCLDRLAVRCIDDMRVDVERRRNARVSELLLRDVKSVYSASSGTAHEWLTWRRALHEFAPLLFQNVK